MTTPPPPVLEATAVHDDAMLCRVVSVLGLHPVWSFSYVPDGAGMATIRVQVRGATGSRHACGPGCSAWWA